MLLRGRLPSFHFSSRSISTTVIWRKQPPHDRQRYKRHHPEPRHSLPFANELPLPHLPRKPPAIDGAWGSIESNLKTLRFKHSETLKKLPTMFDKIQELYHCENNLWYHSLDIPLKFYGSLEFVQQLTRTNLEPCDLEFVESPIVHNYLRHLLTEELVLLNRLPVNEVDCRPEAVQLRTNRKSSLVSSILEAVYKAWIQQEPSSHLPYQTHQIDEHATIETFLKRRFPKDLFENPSDVSEDVFDDVNDTVWDSADMTVRYRIRAHLSWQLRGTEPLQQFTSPDDPACVTDKVPRCFYRPESFDLKPVDCFRFSSLPHAATRASSEFARSVAGYWTHCPFWLGDPCEFGHVGAMITAQDEHVLRNINAIRQPDEIKRDVRMNHGLSEALLAAFAWTSAQAYNQGFTLYNEVTYPFAAQLLLFDGPNVQLLRYQLNSLTSLWKPEDAGLPFNVAWYSPQLPLYEFDSQTSRLVSINPQAISLILNAFLHPTDHGRSAVSLRPYLANTQSAVNSAHHRLIPDSSSADTEDADSDSLMAKLETAALTAATKDAGDKFPTRLFSPGRPHPNEVYFFKETKKSDLITEFKDEMPSFGGPFGTLPEPYATIAKTYERDQRNRAPRSRIQAPPRRWR